MGGSGSALTFQRIKYFRQDSGGYLRFAGLSYLADPQQGVKNVYKRFFAKRE